MAQQIKSNNKNYQKQSDLIPIKLAFQANIFKYVQKKKRQLSVFAALKDKYIHQNQKHSSVSSNLIKQNTAFNFYLPTQKNTIDSEMLLSARIKLADRKPSKKDSFLKRKVKGHKSSLSDWRMLYDERDEISQKHQMKHNSPDKMAVTDRLFYPAKKQSSSVIEKNCSKHNLKQQKAKDQMNSNEGQKFFVSDQNFFHMYHRSVTPIASDFSEKKRIAKYLKENKDRRQTRHGLRLMNEGIFSDLSKNDVAFVPYKFQSSRSNSKLLNDLEENHSYQIYRDSQGISNRSDDASKIKPYNFGELFRGNKSRHIQRLNRLPSKEGDNNKESDKQVDEKEPIQGQQQKDEQQNPESVYLKPNKEISEKNHINLSELFYKPEQNKVSKRKESGQLQLRLFMPRQNKIQKAILNTKKAQSENRFANFQYSTQYLQSRRTSLNTTKHSKTKWAK